MAKQTKQEQVVKMLESKGCKPVRSTSTKYLKFTRPGNKGFYWVGKNGALRVGETVADSISLTGMVK